MFVKLGLPYGLFIFVANLFSAEKSFQNIPENYSKHSRVNPGTLDLGADKLFSKFYYS